eukprot:1375672-Amphidinium_carterae.1
MVATSSASLIQFESLNFAGGGRGSDGAFKGGSYCQQTAKEHVRALKWALGKNPGRSLGCALASSPFRHKNKSHGCHLEQLLGCLGSPRHAFSGNLV